jgi:hypothetical protein
MVREKMKPTGIGGARDGDSTQKKKKITYALRKAYLRPQSARFLLHSNASVLPIEDLSVMFQQAWELAS